MLSNERQRYAVVVGEALIDLIEQDDGRGFAPVPGGSPLNVATGIARLGSRVEFFGSFGEDGFGRRLRLFLSENSVGLAGSVERDVPTSLAVTTFDGPDPRYAFYGNPPSYGLFSRADLVGPLIDGATVIHAGSISLLERGPYDAALAAFQTGTAVKTLDPNVRPSLTKDMASFRESIEAMYGLVDVVKMSIEDATALYEIPPEGVIEHVASFGPSVVVMTRGAEGAMASIEGVRTAIRPRKVHPIDSTGAGDAFMAATIAEIVRTGRPEGSGGWVDVLEFAVDVSAAACCAAGGATSMPTRDEVRSRFEGPL